MFQVKIVEPVTVRGAIEDKELIASKVLDIPYIPRVGEYIVTGKGEDPIEVKKVTWDAVTGECICEVEDVIYSDASDADVYVKDCRRLGWMVA